MEIQRLFLKETLVARFAYMIHFIQVFFHMIMHRILALFDNIAFGANKVAILVLGILQRHGFGSLF
jgi:hypothetical protein